VHRSHPALPWILVALLPLSALLCLPELSTFQLGKAALVGPMLAVLLLVAGRARGRPAAPVLAAALAVVLVGLAALARSPSPAAGAWELWLDLLFLGAVLAGARLGHVRQVLLGAAAAGGALVGVTALEAAGAPPLCAAAIPGAGTMGNPNFTGAVLALAAPAAMALALRAGSRLIAVAWAVLVLVCLAAAVSLGSWTGAVGAGVGLIAVVLHALAARGRRRIALAAGLLALVVAGAAPLSPAVRGHLADRWYMARVSAAAAAEHPIAGHGPGGFPRAWLDAQAGVLAENPDERGRWTRALHAHSEPLHAFAERGTPGLLAWLGLWGSVFWVLVSAPCRDLDGLGLTGILAAGFALSLGEFPGHLVPVQLALGLAVGAASTPRYRPVGKPPAAGLRHLVWLVAIPLFLAPPWLALSDRALNRGDPAEALRINPWNGRAAFAIALAEQIGTAPTGCAHSRLADRLLPSPASAMALGLCLARQGNSSDGVAALRRAARWNPRNAAAHANLAVLLLDAGDPEGARNHALRAASLRPGDPRIQAIYDAVHE